MRVFTFLIVTLLTVGCSKSRYLTGDYEKFAGTHSTLAVLPYDITILGKDARRLTTEQLDEIVLNESKLFQESLYSEVLKRAGVDDKDIQISVQSINRTNRLLKDNGIDGVNISEYTAHDLGKILGVDAVVSTRLVKEGFLDRETALLATILRDAIPIPGTVTYSQSQKLTRTSHYDVYAYIIDVENDAPVWQYSVDCDLSWDMESTEVIENINSRISRRFPYRNN